MQPMDQWNRISKEERRYDTILCGLPEIERRNGKGCISASEYKSNVRPVSWMPIVLMFGFKLWLLASKMEETDKVKTAFTCRQFQFKVMYFGSCSAPATFKRLMETVLAGLNWEICF